jgi:hypothetical protein
MNILTCAFFEFCFEAVLELTESKHVKHFFEEQLAPPISSALKLDFPEDLDIKITSFFTQNLITPFPLAIQRERVEHTAIYI